jgi:mannose-6-phosphate isomerase-like protein (cupin superfamily)
MKKASLLCSLLVTTIAASAQVPPSSITFFTNKELRRAIQAAPEQPGQPGLYALRLSPPSESEVVGIRRTTAARSEQHANMTDVWYVIGGKATLVTGGALQGGVETAPGETRGRAITNGNIRDIQKGDYVVIPAGVPHWISKVEGKEFLYIVVKVPVQNTPHK